MSTGAHYFILFYFVNQACLWFWPIERRLGILGLLRLNNCKTWCARTHSEALFKASK